MRKIIISAAAGLLMAIAGTTPAYANNIDITCATAWLEPHRPLANGDHINIDITKGGVRSQVNAYADRNIEGGWDTLGLRLNTPGGEVKVPLTQAQVESGKLVFNFGQYLAGQYTVEWAQFNNSYFNQDRATGRFLSCGATPPVNPPVDPPTVEICWLLPSGGTGQNVTWPQTYVADCVPPCEQTLQVDRYLASEAPGFYADNLLTQGEDYQSDIQRGAISWRFVVGEACPVVTPPTDTPDQPTTNEPPLPITLASAGPMDAFITLVIGVLLLFAGLVALGLIVYSRFYGRIHGPKRKSLNGSAITEEENR